jgi:uncharacterized protein (DUF58 family)
MRGRRPAGGAPDGVQPIPRRPRIPAPSQTPVDRLELAVLRRLDGLLAGDHAGLLPGHGTERGEARPYVAGDDPRHIDWAVTARTGAPHVRDTIADHELELWLVLDRSASMAVGTGRSTKHELAWSVAGAFALLATGGGNRIGAVTCGRPPRVVPARSGRAHVAALLATLREPPVQRDDADLGAALQRVARSARRRGMVVVVSDFLGGQGYVRPLRALAQRHDVVAVEVSDPRERTLPDVGLVSVEDPETGRRRLVDTRDARVRSAFDAAARQRLDAIASSLSSAGVDQLVVSTERDWVLDVVRFVSGRQARRLAARPTQRKAAS